MTDVRDDSIRVPIPDRHFGALCGTFAAIGFQVVFPSSVRAMVEVNAFGHLAAEVKAYANEKQSSYLAHHASHRCMNLERRAERPKSQYTRYPRLRKKNL